MRRSMGLNDKPGSWCDESGISRPTGYLGLRRYQRQGVQGIAERSRKPLVLLFERREPPRFM